MGTSIPAMFKKTDFARWVCEEHPEYQVLADHVNSQLVLLKYEREHSRFYTWADVEDCVKNDVEARQDFKEDVDLFAECSYARPRPSCTIRMSDA